MSDLQLQEQIFAQCVGFLTQKGTWLFEVDREFASEEWSDAVQFRFVLTPGAYPVLEMRRP
jgi:hypothetical protein